MHPLYQPQADYAIICFGICLVAMLMAAAFLFVYALCNAAKRGEEQGERELAEMLRRRGEK